MSEARLPSAQKTLRETLPEETSLFGGEVETRFIHVPASHAKALHPDIQLVVGMRGAGKSFWWRTLQDPTQRQLVFERAPHSGLTQQTHIAVGFGETPNPQAYPGGDTLRSLVEHNHDPRIIWRTVILNALTKENPIPGTTWEARVQYVLTHPEEVEHTLFSYDQKYDAQGTYWVILFDALDRSTSDWNMMNALIRGLLQAMLDLRPYRRLRAKSFLRTDQLNEREVGDFPDASKVLAGRINLDWSPLELYNLLFQYLSNAEEESFRKEAEAQCHVAWESSNAVWLSPASLRQNIDKQRTLFHAITGPWMGRDRRHGYPYTWVPNHLADAEGRTSPRAFISALRRAAEDTHERYPSHTWPLHYESIKRGVQAASTIRVQELQEDYPWVQTLMEPLSGKVVPCLFEEVAHAWKQADTLVKLQQSVAENREKLLPTRLDQGSDGVRHDLEELGIFHRMRDGRVNVPDVFRVGYGLGRRGGVRPIRQDGTS